ncbi:MAG: hypothetical protein GEU74_09390 [Nitriliruptorales bacterium]|nr:hypothetical protein [Nitriliruptorales bacterium]
MRSTPRRVVGVAALAAVLWVAMAAPAAAHGRGVEASNFISTILDAPEVDGVTWKILGGDQYLSVTNTSDTAVIVPGYDNEPYLRVGPDGVEENRASRATYENKDRYAEVADTPPNVGPAQPPRWVQVSDTPTHAWHDHRIHWMSPALPPVVGADPAKPSLVSRWTVPFTQDGRTYGIRGELRWVPGPSPLPRLGLAVALTLPALLGLRRRGGGDWVTGVTRPAAAVLGAVAALNITHLIDDVLALPLPLGDVVQSMVQTAMFIAIGMFGAVIAWRGSDGAFTALFVGSLAIFVGQGLLYFEALRSSASASVFPDWMARVVIALSLAQILPVGVTSFGGNAASVGSPGPTTRPPRGSRRCHPAPEAPRLRWSGDETPFGNLFLRRLVLVVR